MAEHATWRRQSGSPAPAGRGPASPWHEAVARGVRGRCPACGDGPLFRGYLAVQPRCGACGTALGDLPADDAPPYITLLVVSHLSIAFALLLATHTALGSGALVAITLPVAVLLCVGLLRPIKGGLIAALLVLDIRHEPAGTATADIDRSVPGTGTRAIPGVGGSPAPSPGDRDVHPASGDPRRANASAVCCDPDSTKERSHP